MKRRILALVAALVFSVGFSSTSGPISDLFCIWNTSQVDGIPSPSGSVSAQEVSRLAIHWVAGSVRVEPSENAEELYGLTKKRYAMLYPALKEAFHTRA